MPMQGQVKSLYPQNSAGLSQEKGITEILQTIVGSGY